MDKKKIYDNVLERFSEIDKLLEEGERDYAIDRCLDLLVIYMENKLEEHKEFVLLDPFYRKTFLFRNIFNVVGVLTILTMAKGIYERRNEPKKVVDVICYLSLVYLDIFDQSQAEKVITNGLSLTKQCNYIEGEVELLNILARSKFRLQNYEEAHVLFSKAYEMAIKHNYTFGERLSHNLGEIYIRQKNYEKALEYMQITAESCVENNLEIELGNTYAGISRSLIGLKKYDEALSYIEKAFEISNKYKNRYARIEIFETLSEIHEGKKEYEIALNYIKERNAIYNAFDTEKGRKQFEKINANYVIDSTTGGEDVVRIKNIELETLSDKLRKTNVALEQTIIENQRVQNDITKKNKELEESFHKIEETQKQLYDAQKQETISKLAYEIAEEMVGPLNLVKASLAHFKDEMELANVKTHNGELKRSELIHCLDSGSKVLENSKKNLKRLEIYVSRLKQNPDSSIEMEELKVDVEYNLRNVLKDIEFRLEEKKCIALVSSQGKVFVRTSNNLITSMFEYLINSVLNYGFDTPYNNKIEFHLTELKDKVQIVYTDTGRTIEKSAIDKTFNEKYISDKSEYNNREYDLAKIHEHVTKFLMGEINCSSSNEEGTVIEIRLPKFTKG